MVACCHHHHQPCCKQTGRDRQHTPLSRYVRMLTLLLTFRATCIRVFPAAEDGANASGRGEDTTTPPPPAPMTNVAGAAPAPVHSGPQARQTMATAMANLIMIELCTVTATNYLVWCVTSFLYTTHTPGKTVATTNQRTVEKERQEGRRGVTDCASFTSCSSASAVTAVQSVRPSHRTEHADHKMDDDTFRLAFLKSFPFALGHLSPPLQPLHG